MPEHGLVLRFKVIVADETTSTQGQPDLFDRFSVTVVPQAPGTDPTIVASSKPLPQDYVGVVVSEWNGVSAFKNVEVDLSAYAGQSIKLQFRFETLDGHLPRHELDAGRPGELHVALALVFRKPTGRPLEQVVTR